MGDWRFEVSGEPEDILDLSEMYRGAVPPLVVDGDDGGCWLVLRLSVAETAEAIDVARTTLRRIDGLARVHVPNHRTTRITGLAESPDGQRSRVVEAGAVRAQWRVGSPTILINGEPQPVPPQSEASIVIALTEEDEHLEELLWLMGQPELDWFAMYRAKEVIADAMGGGHALEREPWVTSSELRRFSHSSNRHRHARNSARGRTPPGEPMSEQEAEEFIRRLVADFIGLRTRDVR